MAVFWKATTLLLKKRPMLHNIDLSQMRHGGFEPPTTWLKVLDRFVFPFVMVFVSCKISQLWLKVFSIFCAMAYYFLNC